ncbi:regulatory LuxR family protein [Haloactinopolyspora alba]|uniref:Regulatory LuxR family protein n=1 Tax=Haloactinopolyspora alba TaxID=648780 RepID=A0A2P8E5Q8_9ACTN|nr:helix-turn-helix transcriptional regulator [Haloactinopolyspora alba]PSL04800.1 regulatory LuxR family protein [Haloactinopolyspora alba]
MSGVFRADTGGDVLESARAAGERRAWGEAYTLLTRADQQGPLDADDLERLALAAYLTGRADAAADAWERGHHALVRRGQLPRAARCAFWLGLTLVLRGRHAHGGGWLARAQHLLETAALDCVERGYVRLPAGLQALDSGDTDTAYSIFSEVGEIAERFGDADLIALGRLGRGQALVAAGDVAHGVGMLDEAMVAVTTGDVSPLAAGLVYCAVIIACRDVFDVRRAEEWTVALDRWCDSHQDLEPYRGQCLIHRSEIMQLRGDWAGAAREVRRACEHLSDPPGDPALGMAHYQLAELLRLRGEFTRAEAEYLRSEDIGHSPQPGLALLRLAQRRADDAAAAIRRELREATAPVRRSHLLAAHAEIALARDDVTTARSATKQLEHIAATFGSPYLRAVVDYARGSVLLHDGDPADACAVLRRSKTGWQQLSAPYELGRVRLRMAQAYQRLAEHDAAEREVAAARRVFERLHAAPALGLADEIASLGSVYAVGGLTPREVEVLRLVATGATNRQIADTLVISDKTVARHMSNMFTKLGLTSRAAATAYAYEHHLV